MTSRPELSDEEFFAYILTPQRSARTSITISRFVYPVIGSNVEYLHLLTYLSIMTFRVRLELLFSGRTWIRVVVVPGASEPAGPFCGCPEVGLRIVYVWCEDYGVLVLFVPSVRLFLVSGRPVGALKWRLVRINVLMVFVHPLAPFSVAICVGLSLSNLCPFSIFMVFVHRFGLLLVSDRRRQHARERQFGKKNVVHFLAKFRPRCYVEKCVELNGCMKTLLSGTGFRPVWSRRLRWLHEKPSKWNIAWCHFWCSSECFGPSSLARSLAGSVARWLFLIYNLYKSFLRIYLFLYLTMEPRYKLCRKG